MKLETIKKEYSGDFLNMYKARYDEGKHIKDYEIISRNNDLDVATFGREKDTQAVGIIAFSKDKSRILLQKEFRMATNTWVFNFPGGLVDYGESVEESAIRELKEETGLNVVDIIDNLPQAFSAVGFSDEVVETIVCIADGEFAPSTSIDEQIEANWYTKEEVKELFNKKEFMSLRTQAFLYLWCNL